MKSLKQSYIIKASPEKVFEALTNPEVIQQWTGGTAKMDDKTGTRFELWNGDIHGRNIEVIPNKKLVQEWYGGKWDEPSMVRFTLVARDNETILELAQENIPDAAFNSIENGWKVYYLGPLKELFE